MAGIKVTADDVRTAAGSIAKKIRTAVVETIEFKRFLDRYPDDQALADMIGMQVEEVALYRTAFTKAEQAVGVLTGVGTVPVETDFTTELGQLWGMGAL